MSEQSTRLLSTLLILFISCAPCMMGGILLLGQDNELARGKYKKGTKLFEQYITVQYVERKIKHVLAVLPMKALDTAAQFVPKIMQIVKKICDKIKIKLVIADRGFFSVETLVALESMKLKYLIPCTNTPRVIEALREFTENKRDRTSKMDLTSGTGESIKYTIKITERKKRMQKNPKKSTSGLQQIILTLILKHTRQDGE